MASMERSFTPSAKLAAPGTERRGLPYGTVTSRLEEVVVRAVARLCATSLDERLASGMPQETSQALQARAVHLGQDRNRQAMADSLVRLLDIALHKERAHRATVEAVPDRLAGLLPLVDQVTAALREPGMSVRGLATVSRLLTDGTGPVYNPHSTVDLASALRGTVPHEVTIPKPCGGLGRGDYLGEKYPG
jgi:hypothetical protein